MSSGTKAVKRVASNCQMPQRIGYVVDLGISLGMLFVVAKEFAL